MKVWIVNHYASPPDMGASTRHYSLAKELSNHGHEVIVVAASRQHLLYKANDLDLINPRIVQYKNVRFILLPTANYSGNGLSRIRNMLSFSLEVLKLSSYHGHSPDIIIGSSVHPFAAWAAERLAASYNVPFCFEVRDLWPQTLIDMKAISCWHPFALFLHYLERYLYQKADKIISLLPFAHEYICQFGLFKNKIFYLPNGVDLTLFPRNMLSQESRKDRLTVMYLGSHGVANGLDALVEAAAELGNNPDDVSIIWRFIGEGNHKEKLLEKSLSLGVKNIVFEEGIAKSKVPQILAEADILVANLLNLDIYRYGISLNKLFDYLAAQRPIVFGCAARNNPIEEAGAGITVPPQDSQAIAAAVRRLAALTPEERAQIGLRGRAYVEKYHSYESLGGTLNTVLEDLVALKQG